jgi:hypothetical protein
MTDKSFQSKAMTFQELEADVRRSLINIILSGGEPTKRQDVIAARLEQVKNVPEKYMHLAIRDFVEWMNNLPARTPAEAASISKDPADIIKQLPYEAYELHWLPTEVEFWPQGSTYGQRLVTKQDALNLIEKLRGSNFRIGVRLLLDGEARKIMWIREDGMTSIFYRDGYLVRPIKEFLND